MPGSLRGGRYKIIRLLGAGGFGQTYLAEDIQHPEQLCVIKQFKPTTQDTKMLEVARRLFDTEARTLEQLGTHDQIPELYDFFEENKEFYLVQEFIDGYPLTDEISTDRPFTEEEAIDLLEDVLGVLSFVHDNHVIHRDIKPGNLIRRRLDGRIVLIDFGAVKKIGTQFVSEPGQSSFTVGIGTQGYTPPEQLAGKPRYCSDIYALGMTIIHALTGVSPSHLPPDAKSSDLLWKDQAIVSPAFGFILDRMVRFNYTQRYSSATDVQRALRQMAELPTNLTSIPQSLLPESLGNSDPTAPPNWFHSAKISMGLAIAATLTMTGLLLGIRHLGWLQPLELKAYDQMMRWRSDAPMDSRLLIVEITEADLRNLQTSTPSDQTIADAIDQLQQHQPRVIGLDLYRDISQGEGQAALLQRLQSQDNTIGILKMGEIEDDWIPPPENMPLDRVGFNDIPIDPDGTVRRSLLFASTERTGTLYSFSLRVALRYLAQQQIFPENSPKHPEVMQLQKVVFLPLQPNSGGYQDVDNAGYQILLNYQTSTASQLARTVSLTDLLDATVDPSWIQDKIVLIGTTAESGKDFFATPYSAQSDQQMSGVIMHAQMVSQILHAALDGEPLSWYLPEILEVVWIVAWAFVGAALAWYIRNPIVLGLSSITALIVLGGTCLILFIYRGWVPVVAPVSVFLLADVAVAICRTYLVEKQQHALSSIFFPDSQQEH